MDLVQINLTARLSQLPPDIESALARTPQYVASSHIFEREGGEFRGAPSTGLLRVRMKDYGENRHPSAAPRPLGGGVHGCTGGVHGSRVAASNLRKDEKMPDVQHAVSEHLGRRAHLSSLQIVYALAQRGTRLISAILALQTMHRSRPSASWA